MQWEQDPKNHRWVRRDSRGRIWAMLSFELYAKASEEELKAMKYELTRRGTGYPPEWDEERK